MPGGRHTASPGRMTRSSDAAFTESSVDIDTPAREAIAHQLSPDSTTYVGAFDGEHDDDGAAPAGRHTTSPGWIASSADESLASSNERIDTCAPSAMPNHVSPSPTRWLARPPASQVDVVDPSDALAVAGGTLSTSAHIDRTSAARTMVV